MRAWSVEGAFGLEHLHLVERPDPTPGPYEVVVRVTATSLNYRDLLMVRGFYNPKQPLPLIPVSDGVGVVTAVGPGVTRVAVGDRVAAIFAQKWLSYPATRARLLSTLGGPLDGMLAEQVCLHEDGLVHVPAHLSDAEAATLPCAALTAWTAMVEEGRVTAGSTVLILGTGGVSIFALQFAKMLGARAIVTSSSDAKLERAVALGADHTVNYRQTPEWWRAVRAFTDGEGVDQVIEVGGAGTFDQSVRSVKIGGLVSMIGVLAGGVDQVNLVRVLMQNIRVQGIIVGCRDAFEAMNRAVAHHGLRPVIDATYPFERAPEALAALGRGEHFGKIVIEGARPASPRP